jgi:CHAT domain-containing protein
LVAHATIGHSSTNDDWTIALHDWLIGEGWAGEDDIFLDLDPERGIVAGQRGTGWFSVFVGVFARRHLNFGAASAVQAIGKKLGDLFAGELAAALAKLGVTKGSRLMIMPTGALGFLPLGLAQDPASGRRLVEDYEVAYGPNVEALARAHEWTEQPAMPSLAAVVNPTGDLAFASIEGALIAAEFETDKRIMLDRQTASPEAVPAALKGKSYWHFATHARFDLDAPRQSALALTEGSR